MRMRRRKSEMAFEARAAMPWAGKAPAGRPPAPAVVAAAVCLAIALTGCARQPAPPITLRQLDEAKFADILAQHRGKVVLVDFWATWCGPCVELFPHTVELHRKEAGRGLVVVSVSLDDRDKEAQVRNFLESQRATFDNYIASDGGSAEVWELLGLKSGLPQVKLFDRQGKLRHHFPEGDTHITPADLDPAVETLLAEPG
jgi:thiol-disulfide isomerase/thioredoxin